LTANNTVHYEIDFSVNDSPNAVVAFLRRIRGIFDPATAAWHLDLSKCRYLGPDAVAIIAASVLEARRAKVIHEVVLPKGVPSLEAFCEFSGLNHMLFATPVPESGHPDCVTIPIRNQHVASFKDADPIISLIRRFVPLSADSEDYLRICINEVIQNVQDHARSDIGCVTCARFLKNIGEVRVAIVDRGRGIGSTLRARYPDVQTATEALKRVLKGGYSARSRPNNMGVGISNLGNIIVHQLRGELFMVTEDAFADGKFGRQTFARALETYFPGTGVFFSVPV
jgi:hypothetical protein